MCQTVWIQIRPNILSGLIWVQTVPKSSLQTTLVDKEFNSIVLFMFIHHIGKRESFIELLNDRDYK